MSILKKIIGSYTRKFIDNAEGFEKVIMTLNQKEDLFELSGEVLIKGKKHTEELADKNIFFAVDSVLKKIHNSVFE